MSESPLNPPDPSEPELAPHCIEAARSNRSKCRTCRRKIEKGKLRLGILLEGPYGAGYLWHHLTCAARRHFEDVQAAYAEEAFEPGLEVPPLEELAQLKERAEAERARRKAPPYAERAPSGRARCKRCGEFIEKDSLRVVLAREVRFGNQIRSSPVHVHPGCVAAELASPECLTPADSLFEQLRERSEVDPRELDELLARIGDLRTEGD